MKNIRQFLGTLLLLVAIVPAAFAQFAGGNGTTETPYQITTVEELSHVKEYVNSNFILMNDIDLQGAEWVPNMIGAYSDDHTAEFSGTFDGGGYQIQNVTFTTTGWLGGFFGYINGATIKNLHLNTNATGTTYFGGLVGGSKGGTIQNCTVSGSVTSVSTTGSSVVGGIIGYQFSGATAPLLIENCRVKATVSGTGGDVGGIIGTCDNAVTVRNCAVSGASVTSAVEPWGGAIGGIVGRITADNVTVENCRVNTDVIALGSFGTGGIVGICNNATAIVKQCIFGGAVSGYNRTGGAIGWYSSANALTGLVVTSADFTNIDGTGSTHLGRIIGSFDPGTGATVSNNFAHENNITGITHDFTADQDGVSKTDAELKAKATYEGIGYVFGNTTAAPWTIDEGNDFPKLWFTADNSNVGIPDVINTSVLVAYPNPARTNITVNNAEWKNTLSIELFDLSGRLVKTFPCTDVQTTINVTGIRTGLYVLRAGNRVQKLTISNE